MNDPLENWNFLNGRRFVLGKGLNIEQRYICAEHKLDTNLERYEKLRKQVFENRQQLQQFLNKFFNIEVGQLLTGLVQLSCDEFVRNVVEKQYLTEIYSKGE
jgi:hypothetical protein